MRTHVSRRAFLTAMGAALLAVASASTVLRSRGCRTTPWRRAVPAGSSVAYVDHEGWMLTPADEQKLGQTPGTP